MGRGCLRPGLILSHCARGMDGQGMFRVRFAYLSLVGCFDFDLFLLKASSSPTSRRGPMSRYDHDPSYKSFRPFDVNIQEAELRENRLPLHLRLPTTRPKCGGRISSILTLSHERTRKPSLPNRCMRCVELTFPFRLKDVTSDLLSL